MLPKNKRLNLKYDFKRAASGKNFEGDYLKLFIRQLAKVECTKIGVAVSSKNFKKAVDRNRAKRITFKAFELLYKDLPVSLEIVALPKTTIIDVKSDEVLQDLRKILVK